MKTGSSTLESVLSDHGGGVSSATISVYTHTCAGVGVDSASPTGSRLLRLTHTCAGVYSVSSATVFNYLGIRDLVFFVGNWVLASKVQ